MILTCVQVYFLSDVKKHSLRREVLNFSSIQMFFLIQVLGNSLQERKYGVTANLIAGVAAIVYLKIFLSARRQLKICKDKVSEWEPPETKVARLARGPDLSTTKLTHSMRLASLGAGAGHLAPPEPRGGFGARDFHRFDVCLQ